MSQKGFIPLIIIVVATLVIGAGVGGFLLFQKEKVPVAQKIGSVPAPLANEPTPSEPAFSPSQKSKILDTPKPKPAQSPVAPPEQGYSKSASTENQKPVFKNIGFNLDFYDSSTNKAGDILFLNKIGDDYSNKIFLEFGQEVMSPNGPKILPHPTYFLPLGTKLISPTDGLVERIDYEERYNDYEVIIIPNELNAWRFEFDHIVNLTVKVGDKIKAGDIVGEVAKGNSAAIPPEFGWTELQLWKASIGSGAPIAYCPFMFLDSSVKSDLEAKLTKLAEDWNNFIGKNAFDLKKWTLPGCLLQTTKG